MSNEPNQHQPALPAFELPEYHGRAPVGMRTAITGTATRVTRAHTIGDKIVLVVEVQVMAAAHADTNDGLLYSEKYKALDVFELDRNAGARMLVALRSMHRDADDSKKGRTVLPDLGDIGHADASGVVLTAAEVAEVRGDPVSVLDAPELTPAVVVHEDGTRAMWPDEYPKDEPRPRVGESYLGELGPSVVVRLLDHVTGEELAVDPAYAAALAGELEAMAAEAAAGAAVIIEHHETTATDSGTLDDDLDEWEILPTEPEPAPAPLAELIPTATDDEFLNRGVSPVKLAIAALTDRGQIARLQLVEAAGRGINAKPRPAVQTALRQRLEQLAAPNVIAGNFPNAGEA